MTQYRRKNYNRSYRKKRYRINKTRMALFIVILLSIVMSSIILLNFLLKPELTIQSTISEDLNNEVGKSEFEVVLNWNEIDSKAYDEIVITHEEDVYTIPSSERSFKLTTTEADKTITIEFVAKKASLGFNLSEKIKIKTPNDNESMSQQLTNFEVKDDEFTLTQTFDLSKETKNIVSTLNIELISPVNGSVFKAQPTIISESDNKITTELSVPLTTIQNEFGLIVATSYEHRNAIVRTPVKVEVDQEALNQFSSDEITVTEVNQQLMLKNNDLENEMYKQHYFYAESLHFLTEDMTTPTTYTLVGNQTVNKQEYGEGGNGGIDLSTVEPGTYFIQLDDKYVELNDEIVSDNWYTIQREGTASEVTLGQSYGKATLTVNQIKELPENIYDIIVDPGHGGLDGGSVGGELNERDEVLKVSEYVTDRLIDHGLKVKLTRTDEFDPTGEGNFDYDASPYMEGGRVEQVYQHEAKYVISNHLNSFDKSLRGYQVYSSVAASNEWADAISTNFLAINHVPRDSEKNEYRISVGTFKQSFECRPSNGLPYGCLNELTDYMYYIRETGGQLSHATDLTKYNEEYSQTPTFGAETILIEYAYLDNPDDRDLWLRKWEEWGEAVVKATVEYLNIPYQAK